MGRPRESLQEHLLHGTYRADRHGALPGNTNGYTGMSNYSSAASDNSADEYTSMHESDGRYSGLDFDYERKWLVGADSLAWCLECDASTIRRWASNGTMPKPLKVGNRTLWDAEKILGYGGGVPVVKSSGAFRVAG